MKQSRWYDVIWIELKKIAKDMNKQWRMTECIVDFERAAKLHFQVLVSNVVGIIMYKHYGESVRKLD